MREILFKAKRIDNGRWSFGCYLKSNTQKAYIMDLMDDDSGRITRINYIEVDPNTVCQYTGLTDKNGTKIFEGDIMRRELKIGLVTDVRVMWVNEFSGWVLNGAGMLPQHNKTCEVIGNIHDGEV
jgi:uncharacterized phage protein (TIGR01671 family)